MTLSNDVPFILQMTGRRGRVVILDDGTIQYQLRAEVDVPVEMLNIQEKQRFMRGDKVMHGHNVSYHCVYHVV